MTAATVENMRLTAALKYAGRGWAVFPLHWMKKSPTSNRCSCGKECASPGKHPITGAGFKDASTDPEVIRRWWDENPAANIGIATGAVSGLFVVDIDPDKGGVESIRELFEAYGVAETLEVSTGGLGTHLYFAHNGTTLKNSASKLGPGIDTRGDGGYVVAPPSNHESGNRYTWIKKCTEVRPLPAWILAMLTTPERKEQKHGTAPRGDTATHWLGKALAKSSIGSRNETGLWLACQLRDNGISESEAEGVMRDYAGRVPHGDKPYTDHEALATCRSAYGESPRQPATSGKPKIESRAPKPVKVETQGGEASAELSAYLKRIISGEVSNVPFNGYWLTTLTNALLPGSIATVCGDPSVGKTFFILDNLNFWTANAIDSAVFFIEKDRKFHTMRLLAQLEGRGCYVDWAWIKKNPNEVNEALERNAGMIDLLGAHIFSSDDESINFDHLMGWLKEQAQGGRRVIVVDPITIVDAGRERWLVDEAFIRKGQKVVQEYGCSLVLVTHPKPGANRYGKQTGHDQAGGAAYFRFVDSSMWLHRAKKPRRVRIQHTHGPITASLELFWQLHKTRNGRGGGTEIGLTFGEGLKFVEQGVVVAELPDKEEGGSDE